MRNTRPCFWALLTIVVALTATPSTAQNAGNAQRKLPGNVKPKGPPLNVSSMFKKGRDLFDQAKYGEATLIFNKILKKFPKHQPSIILYGRSLYKLEKLDDAYYLFSRANPALLDPDASYEYGQTFFQKKQYGPALVAFNRVPANHPFGDLSKYYGGISALKLRRYDEAESLIAKAVVLPEKEAKTRSLYLKHIERLKELEQRKALAKERAKERARLRRELATLRGSNAPPSTAAGTAPAPQDPPYDGYFKIYDHKEALIGAKSANQLTSFNGRETREESRNRETYLNLESGAFVPFNKRGVTGYQGAFGVYFKIRGYEEFVQGKRFKDIRFDANEQLLQTSFDRSRSITRIGQGAMTLFVEHQVAPSYWLGFDGGLEIFAPSFERKDRTYARKGRIIGGMRKKDTEVWLKAVLTQSHTPESKPNILETNFGSDALQKFWGDGGLFLDLDFFNYNYLEPGISGPDYEYIGEIGLFQEMPLGFRAEASAAYKLTLNYIAKNLTISEQQNEEVVADGNGYFGRINLNFAPVSWLAFEAGAEIESTQWKVADSLYEDAFLKKIADARTTTFIDINVNLLF